MIKGPWTPLRNIISNEYLLMPISPVKKSEDELGHLSHLYIV